MSFQSKIIRKSTQRASYMTLLEGVRSINIDQKMIYSKRHIKSGSVASDWQNVGSDMAKVIASVKKELATD